MKTLTKLSLLAAALAASLSFVQAADPALTAAPATDKPALAGKHPRLHALAQRRVVRQRIAKRLGLSADQVAQLKTERAKTVAAVRALRALRADTTLAPEQKKAKVRETLKAARAEMRGVFTPAQQQQFDGLKKHLRQKRGLS